MSITRQLSNIAGDEHESISPQKTHSMRRQLTQEEMEPVPVGSTTRVTKTDHPVILSWKNVTYNVEIDNSDTHKADPSQPKKKWRKLLDNMSGIARPGRTLAIMGPSGAGKTTLMSALTGRLAVNATQVLDGRCDANGVPLNNDLKRLVSVVAQDDIVMGKETPRDALTFSVRMRQGYDKARAKESVDGVLDVLGLNECADNLIGIAGISQGISSSEKKRTNIGSELVTEPYIMILDEPTTGLDSVNASRIGQILRDLARSSGRTVICTIHTPSSELFNMFDDLLLLGKGHVVYHGPRSDAVRYFDSIGCAVPPRTNPTEHYMNLLQKPVGELQLLWEAWERNIEADKTNPCINDYPVAAPNEREILLEKCADKGCSWGMQCVLLYARAMRMLARDKSSTIGRLLQVIYLSIIVGLFYFDVDKDWSGVNNTVGAFFLILMNIMMSSAMPAVVMFPSERAVFLMEQANAVYNPIPYALSKIFAEVPVNAVFPVLFSLIVYWMIDLRAGADHVFIFILNSVLIGTVSYVFGFASSTVFSRAELALAFIPLVILPLGIVAGLFANTERLEPDWIWLNYLSFPRYAFIMYADNQYRGLDLCPSRGTECLYQTGTDYLTVQGFEDWRWTKSVWLYFIEIAAFCVIATVALVVQGFLKRGKMSFAEVDPEVPVDGSEMQQVGGLKDRQPAITVYDAPVVAPADQNAH